MLIINDIILLTVRTEVLFINCSIIVIFYIIIIIMMIIIITIRFELY